MDIYKKVLESNVSDTLRQIIDVCLETEKMNSMRLLLAIYKQIGEDDLYTKALKILHCEDVSLDHLVGTAISSILIDNHVEAINYCFKRCLILQQNHPFIIESILSYSALVSELINIEESDNILNTTSFPLVFSSCVGRGDIWDLLEKILCDVNREPTKRTITTSNLKALYLSTLGVDSFELSFGEHCLTEKTFWSSINEILSIIDDQGYLVIFSDKPDTSDITIIESLLHCRELMYVIETDITIIIIKKHEKSSEDLDSLPINKDFSNLCTEATFVSGRCFFDEHYIFDYKPLLRVCESKDSRFCFCLGDFVLEFFKKIFLKVPNSYKLLESLALLNNRTVFNLLDSIKEIAPEKDFTQLAGSMLSMLSPFILSPSCSIALLTQALKPFNSLGISLEAYDFDEISQRLNNICVPVIQEKSELVGRKITFATLSTKFYDCDIDAQALPISKCQGRIITNPCLLVSAVNGVTRIGRVSNLGNIPLCVDDDVEMFELKSQDIFEEYLLYQLSLAQLTISYVDSLYDGYIFVPTLEIQLDVVNRVKSRLISEHEQELKEQYESFKTEISEIEHNIGQDTTDILELLETVILTLELNPTAVDPKLKIGKDPLPLKEYLEKGIKRIGVINRKLGTLTMSYSEKYAPTLLPLNDFLLSYIDENQTPNYKIEYHDNLSPILRDIEIQKGKEVKDNVWCNNNALERILSNIIANAEKYGFRNSHKDSNIVAIATYLSGTDFVVEIANNGEPLDPSFAKDPERCFKLGESTGKASGIGTGLGLYDTRKLMERYGGTIEMLPDPENEFPVTFRLKFKQNQLTR